MSPGSAAADSRFVIRGAGFGHGVGMSQYGAMGFAQNGASYQQILAHYYTGTAISVIPGRRTVRVLLQGGGPIKRFTGATRAGTRRLNATRTYGARANADGTVALLSPTGRRMATVAAPLRVSNSATRIVQLRGRAINGYTHGNYRGALEFRPAGSGLNAINAVSLDDYVQGVVPVESPATWPAEALKAQAVAARTYAITSSKGGDGFEHYPDVRSQVYGGVAVEKPSTNAATQATRGQLVTLNNQPVTTYFFSTSGGRTEDVENTTLGREPRPWLKSVDDPYDKVSPRHRWSVSMTLTAAGKKLGSLVQGSFRGVEVIRRGRSPRVVEADVVGSAGRTRVDGATLRRKLGLFDTWAYFTAVTTEETPPAEEPLPELDPQAAGDPNGGAPSPGGRLVVRTSHSAIASLRGRVVPGRAGRDLVRVERFVRGTGWRSVGSAPVREGGRYSLPVFWPGRYRVVARGATGPVVRVR